MVEKYKAVGPKSAWNYSLSQKWRNPALRDLVGSEEERREKVMIEELVATLLAPVSVNGNAKEE